MSVRDDVGKCDESVFTINLYIIKACRCDSALIDSRCVTQLIYDDLSGNTEEEISQEIIDTSVKLLTDNTEFSRKVMTEFLELPESEAILEKYKIENLE